MTLVEICVEDIAGVRAAREGGADRVELCVDVACGGLTPPDSLVVEAAAHAPDGGLQVLVRPRPGDFRHTPEEVARIAEDITRLRSLTEGAARTVGFVVGVLGDGNRVDIVAGRRLREAAGERPLTFHRAIDLVPDLTGAMELLAEIGYDRVLTTGGDPQVAHVEALRRMCARPAPVVIASGGLRSTNVAEVVRACGAAEVHMRAPRPDGCGTDVGEVRRIVDALGALG